MAYTIGDTATGTSATNTASTSSFTPDAGSALLLFVRYATNSEGASTLTISDTQGSNDTWTIVGSGLYENVQTWMGSALYVLENASATATTVQAAGSVGCYLTDVFVVEVKGVATSSVVVGNAQQMQNSPGLTTDAVTSGNTGTLTSQPAAILGFSVSRNGNTQAIASGTGYTDIGAVWTYARAEHARVTATTAVAATFTEAGSGSSERFWTHVIALAEGSTQSNAPRAAHLMKLMRA
jgi:hypothetical protein